MLDIGVDDTQFYITFVIDTSKYYWSYNAPSRVGGTKNADYRSYRSKLDLIWQQLVGSQRSSLPCLCSMGKGLFYWTSFMQYVFQGVIENPLISQASIFTAPGWGGDEVTEDSPGLFNFFEGISRLDGRFHILVKPDGTYLGGLSEKLDLRNLDTCLDLIDGVICATRPEYHIRLKELLAVKEQDVRTLILPCSQTDGHLIIRATAISSMIVCLSLHRASEMIQPELADLHEVFNLTHAEALIVFDLFLGHTPQEIAAEHNNSIHTIRAHIRRCYDKLGITCREELWRKLNAYRLA